MADAVRGKERNKLLTIKHDREIGGCNTGHDKINPVIWEVNHKRTWRMKFHSSLSKAFSRSILRDMRPCLLLEMVMEWITF